MKLVCSGICLADAALTVAKACAVKTIKPVLECIKIEAKNDVLTLSAYDGEIYIEKKMVADVLEEGEICVNGKFFADFVNKIDEINLVLETVENGLIIKYGDSKTKIQTLSASDFPTVGGATGDEYFELKEKELKNLIAKTVFCAATEDSRPILKGCLIESNGDTITATALDGFRMAVTQVSAEQGSGNMKIVCPARTLIEISRMIEGGDEYVRLYVTKNTLSVKVKETILTSRLYVGEFVRKENIFPVEFGTVVKVNKATLLDSVERASVLIRGDKNNLIVFDIKQNGIFITANSEIGNVAETVEAEVLGGELKIAMNGKFLSDALKALDEEEVRISFNTEISPFTLENKEDKSSSYLILPVRIGG